VPGISADLLYGEVPPQVALDDHRRPLTIDRIETRLSRDKDLGMVTHDFVGSAPLTNALAEHPDELRKILPVEAPRPNDGSAIALEDQHAVEPWPIEFDHLPDVGKPDSVGGGGLFGTFLRVGRALCARNILCSRPAIVPTALAYGLALNGWTFACAVFHGWSYASK
jgi:hypothetical protein